MIGGYFTTGNMAAFSLGGAIQGITVSSVNQLCDVFGVDENLSSVISLSTGVLMRAGVEGFLGGGGITGALASMSTAIGEVILPNLAGELAYYGINKAGELLGVDPRISYIAGIGIRSSLNVGFNGGSPQDIFGGVMQGLLQGVTSIGLDYAVNELDMNPLLANIGFSAISQLFQAAVVPSSDPNDKRNIFQKMFDTFTGNVATFLGYNPTPDRNDKRFWEVDPRTGEIIQGTFKQGAYDSAWGQYYWQESVYTSQIIDFSKIIEERGLVDALNTYATGFFNSTAINAIVRTGMTVGGYFADALGLTPPDITEKVVEVKDENGKVINVIKFKKNATGQWMLVGKKDDTFEGEGTLVVDGYGRLCFYTDAEIKEAFGDYTISQTIENGKQTYAEVRDWDGNLILIVEPTEAGGYNYYDSYGEYLDAKVRDFNNNCDFTFDYDEFVEIQRRIEYENLDDETKQMLATFGITDLEEFGTFTYLIDRQGDMSLSGLVYMSYEFDEHIQNLIKNHPYLFGDILRSCVEYSIKHGDTLSSIVLDMTILDYKYNDYSSAYDYAALPNMQTHFADAIQKFRDKPLFSDDLLYALDGISRNSKGVIPNGSICTDLSEITSYTPNSIVKFTDAYKQTYMDGQNLILLGTEGKWTQTDFYADLDIGITGAISGTLGIENYASRLFFEASGEIDAIQGFFDGSPVSGDVSLGFHSSFDEYVTSKMDIYTYVMKDEEGKTSVCLKFSFGTLGGGTYSHTMKATPLPDLLNRSTAPATEFEADILLLYDVILGRKTNLTDTEKIKLNDFMISNIEDLVNGNPDIPMADVNSMTQDLVGNILRSSDRPAYSGNSLSNSDMYGILVDVIRERLTDGMGVR